MPTTDNYIDEVGQILSELEAIGLKPVLIGGMALVILGSRRVTQDFDFLVSSVGLEYARLVKIFYKKGFALAAKIDKHGAITATLDNQNIAKIRLNLDQPLSAHFLKHKTGLRIDLLFDFPVLADELVSRSTIKKIRSYSFRIAAKEDLLHLKEIACQKRNLAADVQDLAFLKGLLPK